MLLEATNGLCVAGWSALISSQVNKYDKLDMFAFNPLTGVLTGEADTTFCAVVIVGLLTGVQLPPYTVTHYPFHIQSFRQQTLLAAIVLLNCDKLRNIV